ncbi:hypothetical protein NJB14197_38870 [Mycobacterium montefiorense]|uniref:Rv2525c-like glycoside hydrolase-like domain-containing protein n=1 Tax=Mycobacterium montefiorense TaxID=154654 RepID=A0AA37UYH1_9MYCO|nr:hypothetical protein MmonteBS_40130 [Mycobacterium montefiorense]GKU35512.1 hypothetical protein NJB14191_28580 [Mycobacterium montefiorense]GKU40517.1 hypothetical protein NJB14192_25040 [Mycobacterium montefiorense]GKU45020.1 hypothetical protein NJB14194_16440 [Mycobacterium montefiorense]GKU51170.1 hypothetical protein NJB14195_24160 [Mycobacterium montefiorense]
MTGLPALCIPYGFSSESPPIGIQLVSRWFDESTILRLGALLERNGGLGDRRPPIPVYRHTTWESVIGHQRTGVYANSKTIDWALHDGLGCCFWQHNWGSPKGYAHPAANLHQVEIDKRSVGGVGVDINEILKPQFGQWD